MVIFLVILSTYLGIGAFVALTVYWVYVHQYLEREGWRNYNIYNKEPGPWFFVIFWPITVPLFLLGLALYLPAKMLGTFLFEKLFRRNK